MSFQDEASFLGEVLLNIRWYVALFYFIFIISGGTISISAINKYRIPSPIPFLFNLFGRRQTLGTSPKMLQSLVKLLSFGGSMRKPFFDCQIQNISKQLLPSLSKGYQIWQEFWVYIMSWAFLKQPVWNSHKNRQQTTFRSNNVLLETTMFFLKHSETFETSFETVKTTFKTSFSVEEAKWYIKFYWYLLCSFVEKNLFRRKKYFLCRMIC